MSKRTHRYAILFAFAFALVTAQGSTYAQAENTPNASNEWNSAVKLNESRVLANRAIAQLEQLNMSVFVYRSYGEFENDGRLARVSLDTFTTKLDSVTSDVESILPRLSDAKLRAQLGNSLQSYRDGAFWWAKLDQRKVVTIASLRNGFTTTTPAQRFFTSTIPYTVAIHWRQASRYLQQAQKLLGDRNTIGSLTESFTPDRGLKK